MAEKKTKKKTNTEEEKKVIKKVIPVVAIVTVVIVAAVVLLFGPFAGFERQKKSSLDLDKVLPGSVWNVDSFSDYDKMPMFMSYIASFEFKDSHNIVLHLGTDSFLTFQAYLDFDDSNTGCLTIEEESYKVIFSNQTKKGSAEQSYLMRVYISDEVYADYYCKTDV